MLRQLTQARCTQTCIHSLKNWTHKIAIQRAILDKSATTVVTDRFQNNFTLSLSQNNLDETDDYISNLRTDTVDAVSPVSIIINIVSWIKPPISKWVQNYPLSATKVALISVDLMLWPLNFFCITSHRSLDFPLSMRIHFGLYRIQIQTNLTNDLISFHSYNHS